VRAVVQRVTRARVTPGGEIGAGLCILLGVARGDSAADAERLAGKIARLRIFQNDEGKFDRSLLDTVGAALVVSQFTLLAHRVRALENPLGVASALIYTIPSLALFKILITSFGISTTTIEIALVGYSLVILYPNIIVGLRAAPPEVAEPLYESFCVGLRELDVEVATGVFGARMSVEVVNDGPVTIVLGA